MPSLFAGECAGLAKELEESRRLASEASAERDSETERGDDLAAQLEQMTAARDALRCKGRTPNARQILDWLMSASMQWMANQQCGRLTERLKIFQMPSL